MDVGRQKVHPHPPSESRVKFHRGQRRERIHPGRRESNVGDPLPFNGGHGRRIEEDVEAGEHDPAAERRVERGDLCSLGFIELLLKKQVLLVVPETTSRPDTHPQGKVTKKSAAALVKVMGDNLQPSLPSHA